MAALLSLTQPPTAEAQEGEYFEDTITSEDGTELFVAVWRPPGVPIEQPTPVVLTMTPYAALRTPDPVIWNEAGKAAFLARGWTYAQASTRGTHLSQGCGDLFGPGEQQDAVAIVKWADTQAWSNGKVAGYGLSSEAGAQLYAIAGGARWTRR